MIEAFIWGGIGAAALVVGALAAYLTRNGGGDRKDPTGEQADGNPMAIVLGSVWTASPSRSCSA